MYVPKASVAGSVHVAHRPVVGLDAVAADQREHELVLSIAQTGDGLRIWRIARLAVGRAVVSR